MNKTQNDELFLQKLQKEALLQSQLYSRRLLPERLDYFTSLIGRYPWQSLLITSGIVAVLVELFRYWWYTNA